MATGRDGTITPVGRVTSGYQQDNTFNQTFNYDPWGNVSTSGTNNFNPL
jgi:hypothetical protein